MKIFSEENVFRGVWAMLFGVILWFIPKSVPISWFGMVLFFGGLLIVIYDAIRS